MPPELRKRKAPAVEPATAPPAKKKGPVAKAVAKVKEAVTGSPKAAETNGSSSQVVVGQTITLDGFGGEVETNDGLKTTLQKLVDESTAGVVLFTYPKASTPGCTTQACSFRDAHADFTGTGFAVYGLSKDSPKANTSFKTNKNLPYTLLCDPGATLISAIGLKKAPASTTRGVFVIDKSGKILAAEPGSPTGTLETAKKVTGGYGSAAAAQEPVVNGANGAAKEDVAQAETAAQVADTAEKIDSNEGKSEI
ncbi:Thioredoxin peroxidase [Hyphodiscus hymeniophilus]|uniref:thioredoxin-dependent peroxiredoxin n=1 Tax=Hyphodiscus hymeniophilus TaxID=353542 RepID=A0A9P6VR29_9HELO|nr:Thioredoxin peroxidase [Hyphodiscus hymeniophilus]